MYLPHDLNKTFTFEIIIFHIGLLIIIAIMQMAIILKVIILLHEYALFFLFLTA